MTAVAVPFNANMVRAAHSVRAGSLSFSVYGTYLKGPDRTEVWELPYLVQNSTTVLNQSGFRR